MTTKYTRRDSLKLMGAAGLAAGLPASGYARTAPGGPAHAGPAMSSAADARLPAPLTEDLRGIFVILSTPYTASGALDYEDMAFQVEWLQRAGVHGLVWPQNSSDYPRLTRDEIRRGFEVLAEANRGRGMALVLGVQQDATQDAVELARFAETLEPTMMIAMPPKVGTSLTDYRRYFTGIAGVTRRPVMIQTQPNLPGVTFDTEFILQLVRQYPHLGYVKEEAEPVFDRIQALIGQPGIQRVYSAMRGRYFAYDLRLGVDGLVSGCAMYADVFSRMWGAYRAGNWDDVRDIHAKLLVMLNCEEEIPGAGRYLLWKRGIFRTTTQRGRAPQLTEVKIAEIEHNLRGLEPYMLEVPSRT
ncbi:MAG: dihydrodipicolinate synthase family protein [Gemmatimonadetes bacterium]|nr:dihydrodipicolinate synthase family protein [Gemmatimonadota bacterium]